ncbi:hypothetical protein BZM26_25130 [Paraburkholderia strydomiana]|nr:hypothetical protein BZM26_25130 [Paraburkholderia strydomiana]
MTVFGNRRFSNSCAPSRNLSETQCKKQRAKALRSALHIYLTPVRKNSPSFADRHFPSIQIHLCCIANFQTVVGTVGRL